jgi:hypothetical protein
MQEVSGSIPLTSTTEAGASFEKSVEKSSVPFV